MVEPITCLIISCVIGGIAVLVSASIGIISVYSTLKVQRMNEKQINKYKKAKNKIRNKYTINATPDDYIKLACLLHLANEEAKQCTHLNLNSADGKQMILTVSLQNIKIKYKPYETWYQCKCLFDDNDKSIWTTFLDMKARSRFKTYLSLVKTDDLLDKCGIKNNTPSFPPSTTNSEDEDDINSADDYVEFEDLSGKMKSVRRRKVRPSTENDVRAYNTLGLKAPQFIDNEIPPSLPSYWE